MFPQAKQHQPVPEVSWHAECRRQIIGRKENRLGRTWKVLNRMGLPMQGADQRQFFWQFGFATAVWLTGLIAPAAIAQRPSNAATQDQSSPQALADFADAASYQNNQAYEVAIDAWQKFLDAYPTDPKASEARYNLAVCQLQLKKYRDSAENLQKVMAAGPSFARREECLLNLGWTQYTLALENQPELLAAAEKTLAGLLEEFPNGQCRDQALFFLGEARYRQGHRAEAVEAYRTLVDEFPQSDMRTDGMYALGVAYEELARFAESGEVYDAFLAEFPEHALANEVRLRRADTMAGQGEYAAAERRFRPVVQLTDFPLRDYALFRLAFCVAKQDRFQEAGDLYARVAEEFPQSTYALDAALSAGRMYYRADQVEPAARWLDHVLGQSSPLAIEAAHWRARLHLKAKESEAAWNRATEALEKTKPEHPFYAHLLMDQAEAAFETAQKRPESVDLYLRLAQEFPNHELAPQALYNAAYTCLDLKRYKDAWDCAQLFLARHVQHALLPEVLHVAGESELQLGRHQAAIETFGRLIADYPRDPQAPQWRLRRGLAAYLAKDYQSAIDLLTQDVPQLNDAAIKAEAEYLIGMSHVAREKWNEAAQWFQESLKTDAHWRQADQALFLLSDAQYRIGDMPSAKESVKKLLAEFPDSTLVAQAYVRLGEYSYQAGDLAESDQAYSTVIQRYPTSPLIPYALLGHSWVRIRQGDHAGAAEQLTQLLETAGAPNSLAVQARYARALCRQQLGQYEPAIRDIEAFLESKPGGRELSDALYVRGLCESALKQYMQAIATFQSILEQDPQFPSADKVLYELAWAYKQNGDQDRAVQIFGRLVQSHRDSPLAAEASYHAAEKLYLDGKFDQAIAAYQFVTDRAQNQTELAEKARYKLAWSLFQKKDYAAAGEAFAQQIQQFPDGPLAGEAVFMQAECQYRQERYEEAIPLYRQAKQKKVSGPQMRVLTLLHGAQSLAQRKQWQASLAWLDDLEREFPDSPYLPQARYEQAWALQNTNEVKQAAAIYHDLAETSRSETGARARFMLGEIYYSQQQYDQAIKEFQKVMYGYGDDRAPDEIRPWQAKAGFEAGQCAGVLASQERDGQTRQRLLEVARRCFEYVVTRHPAAAEARAAADQLKKYGVRADAGRGARG